MISSPVVPATLMRGGTSKCWIFQQHHLPDYGFTRGEVLTSAFGAVDSTQIDGVGGGTSTTSKAIIVLGSDRRNARIDYLFAQVGIGSETVEWSSDCGNCATALGLHALQAGLIEATHPTSTIVLVNKGTGTRLSATVPTPGGIVPEFGLAVVPGAGKGGVPVTLSFLSPAGRICGRLLPTGNIIDKFTDAEATLIDAGAPAVLADAACFGRTASEDIAALTPLIAELGALRRSAAIRMGIARQSDPVGFAVPKVGIVGPARDYRTSDGTPVAGDDYDLAVRMVSMHEPHPAIGLTSAVAVAAAMATPGTVPARLAARRPRTATVRLGTPAGVLQLQVVAAHNGAVQAVTFQRAARRIATAELYVPILLESA